MSQPADRAPDDPGADEPIDPDVDLTEPSQAAEISTPPRAWAVLAAIAAGGLVGAEARYGVGLALPHADGTWPWSTLLINVSGGLLIGVLMVVILELVDPHPLVRPFLGVGVLGGYTTFSTFAVDTLALGRAGNVGLAVAYAVATPLFALLAVAIGAALARMAGAGGGARGGAGAHRKPERKREDSR